MGFCTQAEHKEFLREVPKFEEMIINSGIIFFKFTSLSQKRSKKKRFKERLNDPLKQFKISPVDQKAQELWDQYSIAKILDATCLSQQHLAVGDRLKRQ